MSSSAIAVSTAKSTTRWGATTHPKRAFWLLHCGGWMVYFTLSYLAALGHGKEWSYCVVPAATALAGALGTAGLHLWLQRLQRLTLPYLLLVSAVPVLLIAGLMGSAYIFVLVEVCGECRPTTTAGYLAYAVSNLYVVLTWLGLYLGVGMYRQLQQERQRALAAQAMAHQAQLKMLRYQLNPHFLFNTLNAISTLVLERETVTANAMVQGLAAFLRHSLDNDPMLRVSLHQECEVMQLYLQIERTRFDERLKVHIEITPECSEALVPSLLLQPLIENAIKYAVAPRVEGGAVTIRAVKAGEQLCLTVSDDGPGSNSVRADGSTASGNGVGLRNTFERLTVIYGERCRCTATNITGGGFEVRLLLPFETATAAQVDS